MSTKAIQTRYKGYHFRSRLEARWAVFFDAMGLEWEYEPEGFELPSGDCYLPDFYLPQIDMFGEVKPDHDEIELFIAAGLCQQLSDATGKTCLLLFGAPKHSGLFGTEPINKYEFEGFQTDNLQNGNLCEMSFKWTDEKYWSTEQRMYTSTGDEGPFPYQFDCGDECERLVMSAIMMSRSARFEHGESGAT